MTTSRESGSENLTPEQALDAINRLRSNIIESQNAVQRQQ